MTAIKSKKVKDSGVPSTSANLNRLLKSKGWQKVKIKGHVVSEDFKGYDGLIGLEVLEQYDPLVINTGKAKMTRKELRMDRKKQARLEKRKNGNKSESTNQQDGTCKAEEGVPNEDNNFGDHGDVVEPSDISDSEEMEQPKIVSNKKQISSEKESLIFNGKDARLRAKILERRQKRRKEKRSLKNKILNATTASKDRFSLLRPPSAEHTIKKGKKQKIKPCTDESTDPPIKPVLSVDELEGWNGLGVPQPILHAFADKGFKSPTEIQALTLPAAILGKKDILGAAETGSGKTLAFGVPILAGIIELKAKNQRTGIRKPSKYKIKVSNEKEDMNDKQDAEYDDFLDMNIDEDMDKTESDSCKKDEEFSGPLYALILTPTRELAVQLKDHLEMAAKYTGIKIAAIFGGLSVERQERILKKSPEIVVATPGRFWELYEQDTPHLSQLEDISFLVIDEADRMVEKDHFEELGKLLKVLNADESKKQARQNFVFSATLTLVHDLPEHMQKRNLAKKSKMYKQTPGMKIQNIIDELGISQPKVVDITRSEQTAQSLTECRLICPIDHKDYYLYYFLQRHPGRTIVFCNSIDCVKRLTTLFGILECQPLPLHANMIQKQRLKNLERFRDNPYALLIATDVAARGLDIPNVEHVIHYQVPRTSENYVHRSGRTARANKDGITVMLMEPGEVKNYVKLYKTLDRTDDLPLFPVSENFLNIVKERVNLARDVDIEELKLRRTQTDLGWMKKHAEDMDIIIDGFNDDSDSDVDEDPFVIERRKHRLRLSNIRGELKIMLAKPMFPKGFSYKYPTATGQLQVSDIARNGPDGKSAVKVMQEAIIDRNLAKKTRNKKVNQRK